MNELNGIYDKIVDKIATPEARLILLEILKKGGKPERVIKACRNALKLFPDDISIRKLLAETYYEQGSIELTERELKKISKEIDKLALIFKLKAEVLKNEDKVEEAIESLKLYLAHHSNDQEAADLLSELSASPEEKASVLPTPTLAEIYYNQGELEEAIRMYQKLVNEFPDDEKLKSRLKELEESVGVKESNISKAKKVKEKTLQLIAVLEKWLAKLRKRKTMILSLDL